MKDIKQLLTNYALNDKNYKAWQKEHTKMFGDIFANAFAENKEAQIHLTAALVNISQRNFMSAMQKLDILDGICTNDYDRAALNYFWGLNYELVANEEKMNEYYQKLFDQKASFVFPLPFHPYYRTAKFAQRDSECGKSMFYYQKALSFYDDMTDLSPKIRSSASQIIYDIATLYLYMHKYDECQKFLTLSYEYDSSENQQRTYVTAILYAAQGKINDSKNLLGCMSSFLRINCEPMIDAIAQQKDLHYSVVEQDKSSHTSFWKVFVDSKSHLEKLVADKKYADCQKIISDMLSKTLPFMKRQIDCRIQSSQDAIVVRCKN